MTDALDKALSAAAEATNDTRQLELIRAVLVAQAITQAAQPQQPAQAAKSEFNTRKWVTVVALTVVGGSVLAVLAIAFAVAMTALAIGATCATACLLILRQVWRDYLKGR